ncbi:hypothetical protein [Halorubrum tebenquichense]|uniref:Uncharacterized protein n=1 Tax=Halorubrum tebenquichense DSM 14210 TaxID=1227485 RepID=M0DUG2_9EURY|nr:hypothetical protein [Halorubrum tebenquichense]ELZ39126.1 hypothetical protein C472_05386 [Halorubrum tebenquichense DSM 14210]
MPPRDAELVIETWRFRERELPRVPPAGWATTDRLREAVCLAVACSVDGVERVDPFAGPATERERFEATVTAESVDHDLVRLVGSASDSPEAEGEADGRRESFSESTKQFDLDEALDRL